MNGKLSFFIFEIRNIEKNLKNMPSSEPAIKFNSRFVGNENHGNYYLKAVILIKALN